MKGEEFIDCVHSVNGDLCPCSQVSFRTRIYHCNINSQVSGRNVILNFNNKMPLFLKTILLRQLTGELGLCSFRGAVKPYCNSMSTAVQQR